MYIEIEKNKQNPVIIKFDDIIKLDENKEYEMALDRFQTILYSDSTKNKKVYILNNLVDGKIVSNNGNAKKTTVMYSFIPIIVSKNSVINEQPISKKYFPLKTNSISEMKIDIIDNFNKPIDFNNESYTIEFHIRERKK
ncbi:TPA_asm: hypothetical protein [Hydra adintovirus]|nr:TPA_asm: hypothetical protein [Hydra adintovirus]